MREGFKGRTGRVADTVFTISNAFRNGRSDAPPLSIHFFTIVLNGEPFIRYHEQVLSQLQLPWHWHIVEGVASLSHDTAWSVASGGHVEAKVHNLGLSNDGTSEYLDDLARRTPNNVTLYRKPRDVFWDGKREMCNAPLANIKNECLLWQVDADELWTVSQIEEVYRRFEKDPSIAAAYYWCHYFVGPAKVISTRYNYAQNPQQEWRRTWRFKPGDRWTAHEPPTLSRKRSWFARRRLDLAKLNPLRRNKTLAADRGWYDISVQKRLMQDEMESAGVVFQHFAYVTEAQLVFKETYYGYPGALDKWRGLQRHAGAGFLRDYFPWVTDEAIFDDAATAGITPIARIQNGRWMFATADKAEAQPDDCGLPRPRIIIDGIFFQIARSGIARVWLNLLRVWSKNGFAEYIIVLDRAGTAPRIEGLHYVPVQAFDSKRVGTDSIRLEEICRQFDADLFVSTYYTMPLSTPSVFMGYDMIPEVMGLDLEEPGWREKHRAIRHASAHIMISRNSAQDLEHFMPCCTPGSTTVAYCGVDPAFKPADEAEVVRFRRRHDLTKPYLLLVGDRTGAGGYKNGELAFKAFAKLPDPDKFTLLCIGGWNPVEANLMALSGGRDVRKLVLSDEDLVIAYAGAHALLYPSRYEGFGLPVAEAMACGCPVITCRNSSLPEVAGEAALYVGEDNWQELATRILDLESSDLRQSLQKRGFVQAAQFDFERMAAVVEAALRDVHSKLLEGRLLQPGNGWRELRISECKAEMDQ